MNNIVLQIHKLLLKKHATLAVAESCTGGLLSKCLTETPGSSTYFWGGMIVYSNQAKTKLLKIPSSLLQRKGAISQEVALKMAENIRALSNTDFGIGITGLAGPHRQETNKQVGTVFIALADRKNSYCKKYAFKGTRGQIRKAAAKEALILIKKKILCVHL